VKRTVSWLGNTSSNEVDRIFEWVMQYYSDASMEISKEEMIVNDDDGAKYCWCMIMEKSLRKGIKCVLQIFHFNRIQK